MMKLSQLVNSALEDAQAKVASARDAEKIAPAIAPAVAHVKVASLQVASVPPAFTATEAMKFAESLEHLAMLFPKLAEGGSHQINDRTGPEIMKSPDKGHTKDTSTKATTLSHAEASHGGGSGDNMHVQTNQKAAEAILEAKIAQSQALLAVGQSKQATALAKQAQADFTVAKRAFDEEASTPHGKAMNLPTNHGGGYSVPGNIPADNAGMINMTKRQAVTDDVRREAGKHVSETALSAATDHGLTDNVEHTEGAKIAKIASIFDQVAARKSKTAAAKDPGAKYGPGMADMVVPGAGGAYTGYQRGEEADRPFEGAVRGGAGSLVGGSLGGTGGGLAGMLAGGALGTGAGALLGGPAGALAGGGIGALLGGGGGGLMGTYLGGVHGANLATRGLIEEAKQKKRMEAAAQEEMLQAAIAKQLEAQSGHRGSYGQEMGE